MYWLNIKGKFSTDDPNLFIQNLKQIMEQTKTIFNGEITQQKIIDIQCTDYEKIENVVEKSSKSENDEIGK